MIDTIIVPSDKEQDDINTKPHYPTCNSEDKYFKVENLLGELSDDYQRNIARKNLGFTDSGDVILNAQWGNIQGDITKQKDLMQMIYGSSNFQVKYGDLDSLVTTTESKFIMPAVEGHCYIILSQDDTARIFTNGLMGGFIKDKEVDGQVYWKSTNKNLGNISIELKRWS